MISYGPSEEQELVRDTVREFATTEMREIARECDEAEKIPEELLGKIWELGLVNSAIPEEYDGGGLDRSPVMSTLVLEELAYGDAPLAVAAMAPSLFIAPLLDFGTDDQKKAYLPLFTTSSFHAGSLAFLEPSFAFDAANLRTLAETKGNGYTITGKKRLVPLGDRASHFLVVARTGARAGLDDLEAFIVPRDAKGLTVGEAEKTLGLRAVPFASLEIDQVEVGPEARLGGEAGIDGRRLVNLCRTAECAVAVGLSRAILELSIDYAKERVAFGSPIGQKQVIAFKLADMQIELNAMRWLTWKAASHLEHGLDASQPSILAQTYVTREAMKVADEGLQIFGGHGYIRDYPVEMWYRNVRTLTALEGAAAV
jgi:alkylation response protein AidB-like acyl-CoA dehydrogenase